MIMHVELYKYFESEVYDIPSLYYKMNPSPSLQALSSLLRNSPCTEETSDPKSSYRISFFKVSKRFLFLGILIRSVLWFNYGVRWVFRERQHSQSGSMDSYSKSKNNLTYSRRGCFISSTPYMR